MLDRKDRSVLSRLPIQHWQCAWCGHLKHHDGTPHGRFFEPRLLAALGYSHGICRPCLDRELARVGRG